MKQDEINVIKIICWGLTVKPKGRDKYETSSIVTSIECSHDC